MNHNKGPHSWERHEDSGIIDLEALARESEAQYRAEISGDVRTAIAHRGLYIPADSSE